MSTARSNQLASPGALRYVSTVASAAAAASPAAMKTGDENARRSSPCSKTYGEYLKKNANSESNTVLSADLCSQWRLSGHSTSRWPFVQRGVRTLYIGRSMFRLVATIALISGGAATLLAQSPAILRWAGDAEGGAPYVEADPSDPSRVVGFDVEVAELIAKGLGRDPRFVEVAFTSIDQSIVRGDADIGLSGIEDTPARRAGYAVTLPYYQFREVLSVRSADAGQFRTLADLRGRRVGTLSGTIAYEILLAAERDHGIVAVSYDDDVHPYSDLLIGRLDAVLLDNVLADRRSRTSPGFITQPEPVAVSHYVGVSGARERSASRSDQRHSAGRHEGWAPRGDLPEVEDLE